MSRIDDQLAELQRLHPEWDEYHQEHLRLHPDEQAAIEALVERDNKRRERNFDRRLARREAKDKAAFEQRMAELEEASERRLANLRAAEPLLVEHDALWTKIRASDRSVAKWAKANAAALLRLAGEAFWFRREDALEGGYKCSDPACTPKKRCFPCESARLFHENRELYRRARELHLSPEYRAADARFMGALRGDDSELGTCAWCLCAPATHRGECDLHACDECAAASPFYGGGIGTNIDPTDADPDATDGPDPMDEEGA